MAVAVGLLAGVTLAACAPQMEERGHVLPPELVAKIKPGVQNRADVRDLLGTPSTVGTFDDRRWYYVAQRTETEPFSKPKVVDQHVLVVEFDKRGVVRRVHELSLANARSVEPVERVTPTRGKKLGFLEQLLGNIGRFTKNRPGALGGRGRRGGSPTQPRP